MQRTKIYQFIVIFLLGSAGLQAQGTCQLTIPVLADSCSQAPLLCHEFLNGFCSNNQNATAVPDGLDDLSCSIENNVWLRIPVCDTSMQLSFYFDNCQFNIGMEVSLLESMDCDSFSVAEDCQIVPGEIETVVNFDGLTPGTIYYLMIDGVAGDVCDFYVQSIFGVHSNPPDTIGPPVPDTSHLVLTTLVPASIEGPEFMCIGVPGTFTYIPPVCGFEEGECDGSNTPGGFHEKHGSSSAAASCFGDEICVGDAIQLDTIVNWDFPPGTEYIGDSTGYSVTVVFGLEYFNNIHPDSLASNAQTDTIYADYYANVEIVPVQDTIDQDAADVYCNCGGQSLICGSCDGGAGGSVGVTYTVEEYYYYLCPFDCVPIGCSPGVVCWNDGPQMCVIPCTLEIHRPFELYEEIVFEDFEICEPNECVTTLIGEICGPGNTQEFVPWLYDCGAHVFVTITLVPLPDEDLGTHTICPNECYTNPLGDVYCTPGNYSWTNYIDNCPFEQQIEILMFDLQNEYLGTTTLCPGDCYTNPLGDQYCSAGNYSWTMVDVNGCDFQQSIDIEFYDVQNEYLGITTLCPGDCYTNPLGDQYCSPGNYSWNMTDSNGCLFEQSIDIDFFIVQNENLGVIDLCPGDCYTSPSGNVYCDVGISVSILTDANGCDYEEQVEINFFDVQNEDLGVVLLCNVMDCYTNPLGDQYCSEGSYSWTMTDANGCNFTQSIEIQVGPIGTEYLGVQTLCPGDCYTNPLGDQYCSAGNYSWNTTDANGCTLQQIIDIEISTPQNEYLGITSLCDGDCYANPLGDQYCSAGNYSWNTIDANGCSITQSIDIEINGTPDEYLGITSLCDGDCYTNPLGDQYCSAGNYSWTMTDADGCTYVQSIDIEINSTPDEYLGTTSLCDGDCYTNPLGDQYCSAGNFSWTMTDADGCTFVQSIDIEINSTPNEYLGTASLCDGDCYTNPLGDQYCSAGNYSWTMTDANGCTFVQSIDIEINGTPDEYLGTTYLCDGNCYTNPLGDQYCSAGNYSWTMTDANGCTFVQSIDIEINGTPDEYLGTTYLCDGNCYTNPLGDQYCSAGNYSWTMTDADGCSYVQSIDIEINGAPDEYLGTIALCDGDCYTNPLGNQYCNAGNYSWTMTNANGCAFMQSIDIVIDTPASLTLGPITEDCSGNGNTFTISFTIFGTVPPYTVNGNAISGNFFTSDPFVDGDNYFFEVKDAGTCEATVVAAGSYQCPLLCVTDAGSLNLDPQLNCPDGVAKIVETGSASYPADQVEQYWLYDGMSPSLANLLNSNTTGEWTYDPALFELGKTYSTARVVGPLVNGFVDINDVCAATTEGPKVTFYDYPQIELPTDNVLLNCEQDAYVIGGTASGGSGTFDYAWQFNASTFSTDELITLSTEGQFELVLTDNLTGCQAVDAVVVVEEKNIPVFDLGPDISINCALDNATLLAQSAADMSQVNWSMNGPDGPVAGVNPLNNYSVSSPGWYYFEALDAISMCSYEDSVLINPADPPSAVAADVQTRKCPDDADLASLTIDAVTGGTAPYDIWLDGQPLTLNQPLENLIDGTYELSVMDALGCEHLEPIEIQSPQAFSSGLPTEVEVEWDESISLTPVFNFTPEAVTWSFSESETVLTTSALNQSIDRNQDVLLTATTEEGCSFTQLIALRVKPDNSPVYIPNVFTPNGDGENSHFEIFGSDYVERIEYLKIYNRWGELVFATEDYVPGSDEGRWDGSFNKRKLQPGVFVYHCNVIFKDGRTSPYQGDVLLLK